MDHSALLATIAPERRLALAYAPSASRGWFLGHFALDARLSVIVRDAREPMLAQIKLAWWREQLAKPPMKRAQGEPLLRQLEDMPGEASGLVSLVDAWEQMLGPELPGRAAMEGFAEGQGMACAALASALDEDPEAARRAGFNCAVASLGQMTLNSLEFQSVEEIASLQDWDRPALGKSMRPLLVLHGLAKRSQQRGFLPPGPIDLLVAIRLGMLGF